MGTSISHEQITLLKRHGVRSVLVLLDGDAAGRVASETVALSLMSQLFTRVVNLPEGQSPDELDAETLSAFLPYWNLKNMF